MSKTKECIQYLVASAKQGINLTPAEQTHLARILTVELEKQHVERNRPQLPKMETRPSNADYLTGKNIPMGRAEQDEYIEEQPRSNLTQWIATHKVLAIIILIGVLGFIYFITTGDNPIDKIDFT